MRDYPKPRTDSMLITRMSWSDSDTLRIHLAGKLFGGTDNQLSRFLTVNGAQEASEVFIDFAEVTFISSDGLHALNDLAGVRSPSLEKISLTRVPHLLRKILKLTRMDKQFRIAESPVP